MAYHWAAAGVPFRLLSRIGDDHAELFLGFLQRHGIQGRSLVTPGTSASIDIVIGRSPAVDGQLRGGRVGGFHVTTDEESACRAAGRMHCVLVDAVADEIERLGAAGVLNGVEVSGDFLSFRHYTVERFARTMQRLTWASSAGPARPTTLWCVACATSCSTRASWWS